MTVSIPILHFNDVYRVKQTSKAGTITADQFAAKISTIRESWGEQSRALDFLIDHQESPEDHDGEVSKKRQERQKPLLKGLVLFSGDVFNPSIESSVTRGEHMIDVLNACSIDCACLGNHDFDFGYPHLQRLMQQTNFPWTFTNIADVDEEAESSSSTSDQPLETDKQVGGTVPYWICEIQNVRIGCIGLVEKDWIATVPAFPPTFRYRSMVKKAKQVSEKLRVEEDCDIIIALSHCRLPNDIDLCNDLGATKDSSSGSHGVDLVLGGHDHTYYVGKGIDDYTGSDWHTNLPGEEKDDSCLLVKSGTDFHDLSEIQLEVSEAEEGQTRKRRIVAVKVKRHSTSSSDPTLTELKSHIDKLMERVDQATGQPVAFSLTPLDCRMGQVRTDESATGDLIADILLHSYEDALRERSRSENDDERRSKNMREIDMALICGGSLRGDAEFGPGTITLRDILTIMPFEDSIIVKELKGQDIWDALENGLGAFPSQEGRFPQVAGISIQWDSRKPPGERLVEVCLLEDVHLFHDDGRRRQADEMDAAELTSYAFQQSDQGGYSIEVNRPKIRKGKKLVMDQLYRVCTREYMASGHDGYEALSRGKDIIDHESGSLMSTQVRKFLLGASLIWRLKSFRESSDETGKGVVGSRDMLSQKTRRAIERAQALARKSSKDPIQETDNAFETPKKKPAPLSGFNVSPRVVVDSSPGGIRDAIHAGASEHHSEYDAASIHFKGNTRQTPNTANVFEAGDTSSPSRSTRLGRGSKGMTNGALSAPADNRNRFGGFSPGPSPLKQDESNPFNDNNMPADTFSDHLEVSPEDAEVLRHLEADMAVIAPLIDGRMVDVARQKGTTQK